MRVTRGSILRGSIRIASGFEMVRCFGLRVITAGLARGQGLVPRSIGWPKPLTLVIAYHVLFSEAFTQFQRLGVILFIGLR
jgi:hypothetical protein